MATLRNSIIGSEYCLPESTNLKIENDVTYINGEVVFRADAPSTFHHRRALRDVSGNPVLTLYKKRISTAHGRWRVFKGDSKELLFSVKRPSIRRTKNIDLDVFLADNKKESVRDFNVRAAANKKSCNICAHGSPTILAKMTNAGGAFQVEVQPNADYAFIAALLTIVDDIHNFEFNVRKLINGLEIATAVGGIVGMVGPCIDGGGDDDDDDDEDDDDDDENKEKK